MHIYAYEPRAGTYPETYAETKENDKWNDGLPPYIHEILRCPIEYIRDQA